MPTRTLAELLGAYGPGHVIFHGGRGHVFSALTPTQLGALLWAWRGVHAGEPGVRSGAGPFLLPAERAAPLGEAFADYLCVPSLYVLMYAMAGCEEAEARALYAARRGVVRHVCLCVLWASEPRELARLLALPEDHPDGVRMAETIEAWLACEDSEGGG